MAHTKNIPLPNKQSNAHACRCCTYASKAAFSDCRTNRLRGGDQLPHGAYAFETENSCAAMAHVAHTFKAMLLMHVALQ